MTQEEKAKVYTELINRLEDVKNAIKKQNYGIAMDILCKSYPEYQIITSTEFKESEDERIRKEIIYHIKNCDDTIDEKTEKRMIVWLEKQGEQKSIEYPLCKTVKDKIDYYIVNHFTTDTVVKTDVNSIVKAMKEGVMIGMSEQKPAYTEKGAKGNDREIPNSVWSEEDEARFESCIKVLQTSDGYDTINAKWLKSLKDRVQPQQQEWSEKDERMFKNTIALIETLEDYNKAPNGFGDVKFWLKSLKERYAWKPSDEQMKALNYYLKNDIDNDGVFGSQLVTLYQDLLKLRKK